MKLWKWSQLAETAWTPW